jgi:hypothetical protein
VHKQCPPFTLFSDFQNVREVVVGPHSPRTQSRGLVNPHVWVTHSPGIAADGKRVRVCTYTTTNAGTMRSTDFRPSICTSLELRPRVDQLRS